LQRMKQLEMDILFCDTLLLEPFANGEDHLLWSAEEHLVHGWEVDQPGAELGAFLYVDATLVQRDVHLLPAEDMMHCQPVYIPVLQRLELFAEDDRRRVAIAVYQREMALRLDGQGRFYQGDARGDAAARRKGEIVLPVPGFQFGVEFPR